MNHSSDPSTHRQHITGQLRASAVFRTYAAAFMKATGLPLILESIDNDGAREMAGSFCQLLNGGDDPCAECGVAGNCLAAHGSNGSRNTETNRCFAGLTETTVPVVIGNVPVARLRTGHVFMTKPKASGFASVAASLRAEGLGASQVTALKKAWLKTPVVDRSCYEGATVLLRMFAQQLAGLSNQILLAQRHAEPVAVTRAKEFIRQNLDEPLSLGQVAREVHVSSYYFCKIFKQSTGMTFTEYVNRQRIEWAKRELAKPNNRVTEIAYAVGYQSLSQFNRSFLKIAGESPTQYREHLSDRSEILVA